MPYKNHCDALGQHPAGEAGESRLRRHYDLDLFVMVLLIDQLGQIETLEQRLRALQARVPQH